MLVVQPLFPIFTIQGLQLLALKSRLQQEAFLLILNSNKFNNNTRINALNKFVAKLAFYINLNTVKFKKIKYERFK